MKIELDVALTVCFVVLKLIGIINWNWWLVVLPILIGIGINFIIMLIGILIVIIASIFHL